jgi:hypothetical protein
MHGWHSSCDSRPAARHRGPVCAPKALTTTCKGTHLRSCGDGIVLPKREIMLDGVLYAPNYRAVSRPVSISMTSWLDCWGIWLGNCSGTTPKRRKACCSYALHCSAVRSASLSHRCQTTLSGYAVQIRFYGDACGICSSTLYAVYRCIQSQTSENPVGGAKAK